MDFRMVIEHHVIPALNQAHTLKLLGCLMTVDTCGNVAQYCQVACHLEIVGDSFRQPCTLCVTEKELQWNPVLQTPLN